MYTHFAARNAMMASRMNDKRTRSLARAFRMMCSLTRSFKRKSQEEGVRGVSGVSRGVSRGGSGSVDFENGSQKKEYDVEDEEEEEEIDIEEEESEKEDEKEDEKEGLFRPPTGLVSKTVWVRVVQMYRPQV